MLSRIQFKKHVWMNIAREVAKLSHCKRLQVGCVVMKDERIVSVGYNGTPKGFTNECEDCDGKTNDIVIHAEANAIAFAAKNGIAIDGCTLYITHAPCYSCSRLIVQSGINCVIYSEDYHSDGLVLLSDAGIKIEKV